MRDAILSVNEKEFILRARLHSQAQPSARGLRLTWHAFAAGVARRPAYRRSPPLRVEVTEVSGAALRQRRLHRCARQQTLTAATAWPAQLRDDGNCEVQLGHTRVLAVVSAELVRVQPAAAFATPCSRRRTRSDGAVPRPPERGHLQRERRGGSHGLLAGGAWPAIRGDRRADAPAGARVEANRCAPQPASAQQLSGVPHVLPHQQAPWTPSRWSYKPAAGCGLCASTSTCWTTTVTWRALSAWRCAVSRLRALCCAADATHRTGARGSAHVSTAGGDHLA